MQYNTLPRTNIKVSQLCLGTMMFGGQTSEAESFRVMDAAHDLGVNFFDTANIYQNGETERIVGKWLKNRRNEVVLATKVRGRFGDGINDEGLSRDAILRAAEDSLRRLQTDHIDIYYLHMPDHDTALYETLQTMDSLVRAGKVRHVGVSNYAAWQVMEMLAICRECGFEAPIVTQNVWNLVTRGIEQELQGFLSVCGFENLKMRLQDLCQYFAVQRCVVNDQDFRFGPVLRSIQKILGCVELWSILCVKALFAVLGVVHQTICAFRSLFHRFVLADDTADTDGNAQLRIIRDPQFVEMLADMRKLTG